MKYGIISDSHDCLESLRKAVEVMKAEDVTRVLHAGDIVSPFACLELEPFKCNVLAVFGNNDGDRLQLFERFRLLGEIFQGPKEMLLETERVLLMHEPFCLEALIKSGEFDLIVYGHTHIPDVRKSGKTVIVNPGELCGWLSHKSTLAIYDTNSKEARIIEI